MEYQSENAKDIYWIGGSDQRLALFENMFPPTKRDQLQFLSDQ